MNEQKPIQIVHAYDVNPTVELFPVAELHHGQILVAAPGEVWSVCKSAEQKDELKEKFE